MRRTLMLLAMMVAAGCMNSAGLGYGDGHTSPELVFESSRRGAGESGLAFVVRAASMKGSDRTAFTAETAPDISVDVAVVDVPLSYDYLSVGLGAVVPRGPWQASLIFSLGVTRFDKPALSAAQLAALAAAQVSNVTLSYDRIAPTFALRGQLARVFGGVSVAMYAEVGDRKSDGGLSYDYAPMGSQSEGETWRDKGARYGVIVAYRF